MAVPRLLVRLGRAQAEETARGIARKTGLRRASRLTPVPAPDTPAATAAARLCAASVPPVLVGHRRRTDVFSNGKVPRAREFTPRRGWRSRCRTPARPRT